MGLFHRLIFRLNTLLKRDRFEHEMDETCDGTRGTQPRSS